MNKENHSICDKIIKNKIINELMAAAAYGESYKTISKGKLLEEINEKDKEFIINNIKQKLNNMGINMTYQNNKYNYTGWTSPYKIKSNYEVLYKLYKIYWMNKNKETPDIFLDEYLKILISSYITHQIKPKNVKHKTAYYYKYDDLFKYIIKNQTIMSKEKAKEYISLNKNRIEILIRKTIRWDMGLLPHHDNKIYFSFIKALS